MPEVVIVGGARTAMTEYVGRLSSAVGFALMSALRTIGDVGDKAFGMLDPDQWHATVQFLRDTAETCLLVAMSAVGLTSAFASIIGIGLRPFALGLFAALLVGGVSFALIAAFAADLIQMVGL